MSFQVPGILCPKRKGSSTEYHIKSGEGFMMFPQQVCSYWADMELPWEYVWIEFDGLRVKRVRRACGPFPEHPVYHSRSKELREKMMEEMLTSSTIPRNPLCIF